MENDKENIPDSNKTPSQSEEAEATSTPQPEDEIDLNSLFPDEEKDLNSLFPDEESRILLKKINKNKKDLHNLNDRFHDENDLQENDESASRGNESNPT